MATLQIEPEREEHFQALREKKLLMQKCQSELEHKSCLSCKQVCQCKIREEYVKAVYLFLNEGKNANFAF